MLKYELIMQGFPMARNLRKKMPAEYRLIVQDINVEASSKLVEELPNYNVTIGKNAEEVGRESSMCPNSYSRPSSNMMILSYQ